MCLSPSMTIPGHLPSSSNNWAQRQGAVETVKKRGNAEAVHKLLARVGVAFQWKRRVACRRIGVQIPKQFHLCSKARTAFVTWRRASNEPDQTMQHCTTEMGMGRSRRTFWTRLKIDNARFRRHPSSWSVARSTI